MWYYAKAALQNVVHNRKEALATVNAGERVCAPGSFLASSMRVLRIMIEAEVCPYNSTYEARLLKDIKWLAQNGKSLLTPDIIKRYQPVLEHDSHFGDYYSTVFFPNNYYWGDVLNRILVDVLATRLKKEGHVTEALLYNDLGVFWVMKTVYGKPESPNRLLLYSTTNLTNALTQMADTCQASDLAKAYNRIAHPTHGIDSLVVLYGQADKSFWCDQIGTHYIAEQNYPQAVAWLKGVSHDYQRSMSTWDYFDRDPFCFKIGWNTQHRHHLKDRYDYKLNFAKEMVALQEQCHKGKTANERGKALIRIGVGLRNQKEWCWSLSRYSDTSENYYACEEDPTHWGTFIDVSYSQKTIDRGIATLSDPELKAYYLHLFARNREVMKMYPNTKTAQQLRAHCDRWRDYAAR